jgi:fructosamine-3-kinase
VITDHPLNDRRLRHAVEKAASTHRGRTWFAERLIDLNERASHPCGILVGPSFSVFVKLSRATDGATQFEAELRGSQLLARRAGVATPIPVGDVTVVGEWSMLLTEALGETAPERRSTADWESIGRTLAAIHQVRDLRFGLAEFDGFFGPLPQNNRPVPGDRWADFYVSRRLEPYLRAAIDSGHMPASLDAEVARLLPRVESLCGPDPTPSLLHGDAQQNNFLSTTAGAVVVDVAPYFGHPEIDLALIDYFTAAPDAVFGAYRELAPIDAGFAERRELWRLHGYLAVVAVDGASAFGRTYMRRLADAVALYR